MIGQPPGWYRDPVPPNPAVPDSLRWWDGQQWTSRAKPAPRAVRAAWRAEAAAQRPAALLVQDRPVAVDQRVSTPDGDVLAGWWRRVGAQLVDQVVAGIASLLVGWPFLRQAQEALTQFLTSVTQAQQTGSNVPDPSGSSRRSVRSGPTTSWRAPWSSPPTTSASSRRSEPPRARCCCGSRSGCGTTRGRCRGVPC